MTEVALVARLTFTDLRRNVGAWRLPALSSVLFAILFVGTAATTGSLQDRAEVLEFKVAVDGAREDAPLTLDLLATTRLALLPPAEAPDAARAVRARDAAVGITLPAGLDDDLLAVEPVEVVVAQRSRSNVSQEGTGWVLTSLAQVAGRGIVADVTEVDVNDDPLVARRSFSRTIAALTAFLALGVVTSVATVMGGTRDRRAAEPLLVTPLARTGIAAGIAVGALPMGALYVGAGVTVLLATATLPLPTLDQPLEVLVGAAPVVVAVVVAVAALGAGLGLVAGALGGGSADAMGTGDLLAVPLAALGVGLLLAPDLALATPTACAPGLGVLLGLRDALAGTLDPALLVVAVVATTAAAALLVWLAGRLLGHEANIRRV